MEILLNLIFYDIKWIIIKYIPLYLYRFLFNFILILNTIQALILIGYSFNNELNFQKVNFLIIVLINIFLLLQYNIKLDDIYYKEFSFIHEAKKINTKINIAPYEVIIRARTCESFIGILNFAFSFYKLIATLNYDFCDDLTDYFTSGFSSVLTFIVFELYQIMSLYCLIYLIIVLITFIVIKAGFIYISCKHMTYQAKVQHKLKMRTSIDRNEAKSTYSYVDMIEKLQTIENGAFSILDEIIEKKEK